MKPLAKPRPWPPWMIVAGYVVTRWKIAGAFAPGAALGWIVRFRGEDCRVGVVAVSMNGTTMSAAHVQVLIDDRPAATLLRWTSTVTPRHDQTRADLMLVLK
jgi:hypothetical protein